MASDSGRARFDTTRWSVIQAAGSSDSSAARRALAIFCESYWYPIYAQVRREGHSSDDARDLTQAFFVSLLERDDFQGLRPERGRLRAFLIVALRHFLENDRDHGSALKRGGGQVLLPLEFDSGEDRYLREVLDTDTPESIFDRRWALSLLERVFQDLRNEWQAAGRASDYERLKASLMGELPTGGYKALAEEMGITEGAARTAVHRLRRRFQQRFRQIISETVAADAIDDEIRCLLKALQ